MSLPDGIRHAVPEDLEKLYDIEQKCFPGPLAYPRKQIQHLAFKANSSCLVDETTGAICGFIIVLYRTGSQVAGIETVDVDPECRGQGIGLRLISAAEGEMRARGVKKSRLEVAQSNTVAIQLYKKAGYSVVEELVGYYQYEHDGTRDAFRMIKHL